MRVSLRLHRDYAPAIGLGLTQILGWGALVYAYAVLLPDMAQDLGLTLSSAFGILSVALFFGGMASPLAGLLVDRFGGRWVMTGGALVAGLALIGLGQVDGRLGLFAAIVTAECAAMFVLYNAAFASVARLDLRISAARAISIITLFGGLASTVFWPLTLWLLTQFGWQTAWVVLGTLYICVAVPVHAWVLRGADHHAESTSAPQAIPDWPELTGAARRQGMLWMVISFAFSNYIKGGVMVLWVTNVQDLGHSAAMAALAGAVIGPFKTVGRFVEMLISRDLYPRVTYALALGLMLAGFLLLLAFGITPVGIILAAAVYGMGDGITTIARGTLPLALFGSKGFGARLGWINTVLMAVNASAAFVFAWATQTFGGWWSFAAMTLVLVAAWATYLLIPDPRRDSG